MRSITPMQSLKMCFCPLIAIAGLLCFSTYASAQPKSPRSERDEISRQYARCELEAIRLGTTDYWHYLSACMRAAGYKIDPTIRRTEIAMTLWQCYR
jgi:hypothetical protein